MRRNEKGFTIVELVIAVSISVLVTGAAAMSTFQVLKVTQRNNDQMTVVRQVQNAGYWISRDAEMAQSAQTDNLTPPDFLVFNWTSWDLDNQPIYHSVTYYFAEQNDGIGQLNRRHWSSGGANENTLIANRIYYDLGNPQTTSNVSYQNGELIVHLTGLTPVARETREYRIIRRLNF